MRTLRVRLRPPPVPIEVDRNASLARQQLQQERQREQQARLSAQRTVSEIPGAAGVRFVSPSTYYTPSSAAKVRKAQAETLSASGGTRSPSRSESSATWEKILRA